MLVGVVVTTLILTLTTATATAGDRVLRHEAIVDAPIADVWEVWTTNEGIRSWMVPHGKVDFRVGGEYRTSYSPDVDLDGKEAIVNRILVYEPLSMIAMKNVQAPPGFGSPEMFQQTWSVMRFEPVGTLQTRVIANGYGYGEGDAWDELYNAFERGNEYVMSMLQQRFASEDEPEKDYSVDAALKELGRLAGGAWHVRAELPDGNILRSVFVAKVMNGGTHLMTTGWLGDDDSLHSHAVAMCGVNPETGTAWFWEFLEQGMYMDGPVWVENGDVYMDLTLQSADGESNPMRSKYHFTDDDHFDWVLLDAAMVPATTMSFERISIEKMNELVGIEMSHNGINTEQFASDVSDRAIVVERDIDAPVADVWDIWTTNAGFQAAYERDTNIDLRIGGPFEIFWDSANRIGSNGCQFLSYSPKEYVAFSWNAPPTIPEIREKRTVVTVSLEDLGNGRTRMRLKNDGYGIGESWDQAFAYFEAAWERVADTIESHFADVAGE